MEISPRKKVFKKILTFFFALTLIVTVFPLVSTPAKAAGTVVSGETLAEGVYMIRNRWLSENGRIHRYLDIDSFGGAGSTVCIWKDKSPSPQENQFFHIKPLNGNKDYLIIPLHAPDTYVSVPGNPSTGSYTGMYTSATPKAYKIERVGSNDYYSIKRLENQNQAIMLNISVDPALVIDYPYDGTGSCQWYFEYISPAPASYALEEGIYMIRNQWSVINNMENRYLDVDNAGENHSTLHTYMNLGSNQDHQFFYVKPVYSSSNKTLDYNIIPMHTWIKQRTLQPIM